MKNSGSRKVQLVAIGLLAALSTIALSQTKRAGAADPDPQEKRERCAVRVSIAMLGQSPAADVLSAPDPQSKVDAMLRDPAFIERFARFANQQMNMNPADTAAGDASYYMTRFILTNSRPWKDAFTAPLNVVDQGNGNIQVVDDANGLGYFRSPVWLRRYAGNELTGLKIVTAYRIMNNVMGLQLTAVTTAPDADISEKGRQAQPCAGCHNEKWYALDKVANVLTRKREANNNVTFDPAPAGAQHQLDTTMIKDDKDLVNALVASEDFTIRSCRLAFNYLYGRAENVCEGQVFDKCVDAFKANGTMQAAVAAVAKDPSFCQ